MEQLNLGLNTISEVSNTLRQTNLINADCREIIREVIENSPNPIVVTDPPFNIGYHYKTYKDNVADDVYMEMLKECFMYSPFVVIHYPEAIYKIAQKVGQVPQRVVAWVYNSNTAKQHRDIAYFGVKPNFNQVRQPYKNLNDKRIQKRIAEGKTGAKLYDWWEINQVKNVSQEKTAHPCQMPVEVMKRVVGILPKDATIIDPFMGSGTTGMACAELGYKFVGIELDKEYFEIAKERIEGN